MPSGQCVRWCAGAASRADAVRRERAEASGAGDRHAAGFLVEPPRAAVMPAACGSASLGNGRASIGSRREATCPVVSRATLPHRPMRSWHRRTSNARSRSRATSLVCGRMSRRQMGQHPAWALRSGRLQIVDPCGEIMMRRKNRQMRAYQPIMHVAATGHGFHVHVRAVLTILRIQGPSSSKTARKSTKSRTARDRPAPLHGDTP